MHRLRSASEEKRIDEKASLERGLLGPGDSESPPPKNDEKEAPPISEEERGKALKLEDIKSLDPPKDLQRDHRYAVCVRDLPAMKEEDINSFIRKIFGEDVIQFLCPFLSFPFPVPHPTQKHKKGNENIRRGKASKNP